MKRLLNSNAAKRSASFVTKKTIDHVVIGLGGLGSSAIYWLAQIGQEKGLNESIVGIEQFELGHERGASHDHSRIIRYSYHTPAYVTLAKEAYETWDFVADEFGEELIVRTGGIDLFPKNCAIPISTYKDSLDAVGVPYELLDAAEIMKRYPQFKLSADVIGLSQAETGIAPAAKGTAAHQKLAQKRGVEIKPSTRVMSLHSNGDGDITIATDKCVYNTSWYLLLLF